MDTELHFNRAIIEELYAEALMLADEARAVFDLRSVETEGSYHDEVRIALSIEGLRTTTRVMHVLAWLLNQRAYLSGELSELQLRRHGALPEERPSDETQLAKLEPATRELIRHSESLHRRIARLDRDWRAQREQDHSPVRHMQGQIAQAFRAH